MEQSDEAFDDAREIVRVIAAFASARTRSDVATPFAVAARAGPNFVEHVFGFQEEGALEKQFAGPYGAIASNGRHGSEDDPKITCAAKQHALYLAPQKRDEAYEVAILSSVFCSRARMPRSLESP